jgi:hypothetical protein
MSDTGERLGRKTGERGSPGRELIAYPKIFRCSIVSRAATRRPYGYRSEEIARSLSKAGDSSN